MPNTCSFCRRFATITTYLWGPLPPEASGTAVARTVSDRWCLLAGSEIEPHRNGICPVLEWRREGDSNPRDPQRPNGFQDRRNRPLCHPSSAPRYAGDNQMKG